MWGTMWSGTFESTCNKRERKDKHPIGQFKKLTTTIKQQKMSFSTWVLKIMGFATSILIT
jgi:hypothetical protein